MEIGWLIYKKWNQSRGKHGKMKRKKNGTVFVYFIRKFRLFCMHETDKSNDYVMSRCDVAASFIYGCFWCLLSCFDVFFIYFSEVFFIHFSGSWVHICQFIHCEFEEDSKNSHLTWNNTIKLMGSMNPRYSIFLVHQNANFWRKWIFFPLLLFCSPLPALILPRDVPTSCDFCTKMLCKTFIPMLCKSFSALENIPISPVRLVSCCIALVSIFCFFKKKKRNSWKQYTLLLIAPQTISFACVREILSFSSFRFDSTCQWVLNMCVACFSFVYHPFLYFFVLFSLKSIHKNFK